MEFNFTTFSAFTVKAYREIGECRYTVEEVLAVFKCYFSKYKQEVCGDPHPNIRISQIKRIIKAMPYLDADHTEPIAASCYPAMIDRHFDTEYSTDCNYNINHFFSGSIRELRYYETCY